MTDFVTHNEAECRFEVRTEAGLGHLTYTKRGDTLDLAHTLVPEAAEERGHGSALARAALEYARANGLRVLPTCPFVRAYMEKHPEYGTLNA